MNRKVLPRRLLQLGLLSMGLALWGCGADSSEPSAAGGSVAVAGSVSAGAGLGGAAASSFGGSIVGGSTGAQAGAVGFGGSEVAGGGSNAAGASTGGASATGGGGGALSQGGAAGSAGSGSTVGTKSKGCGAVSWPMTKNGNSIMVDGKARTYNLRLPENYDPNRAYRLVLAYHWLGGTADNVSNGNNWATGKPYYGLWELSKGSTIFVAPQGISPTNGWGDSGNGKAQGGQDVAFTRSLIEQLQNTLCIDTSRIFAEGFSMGGSMSYALACAMGGVLRGVAVHSGGPMSGCMTHDKPVAYFMTHGTKDGVCTYPQYGVPQLNDFAKANGCTAAALPTPTSSASACIDFQGCSAGHPTRGCVFVGDHTPSPGGTMNSWVPAETWKFVTQF